MPDSLTIVPAAVQTAVKPKPTRAEIIDAMTHLRIAELTKKREEALTHHKALTAKLEKALIAAASKATISLSTWNVWNKQLSVSYSLKVIPPHLQEMADQVNKAAGVCRVCTDFKTIRQQVARDAAGTMDRTERVEALLKDPEAVKALKGALEKIY